jgi:presequence protease
MVQALDVEGQEYRGFIVTKYLHLKELQSTLIEIVHEKTGGRIIQIANDDPENLFALSFQTLPDSSNGVAHALEHIVLCGSKKFPIKDPFFSMTRRSLNTYMNALTGQDFTVYPASSQVEKDFYNLLEVYLDAVFHPLLKHPSFLQEAHRLCFATLGDLASPLQRQGIVYNEMKGAMSSSDERLSFQIFSHLMPDLPYAYNSGGDPKEIPSLTYAELCDFHRTFYHPSRCLFFFYGNLPLAKHLDFLHEHALNQVQKVPLLAPLALQKRFTAPWHAEGTYPISPEEDIGKKTIIALGFLTAPISHQTDLLALSLLDSLLTDTDVSPLKLALLQSKLCTSVESHFDTEMSEAPWLLICKGCDEGCAEKIVQTTRSALEKLAQKGFDFAAIEASLHQLEFERTEIGADNIPFGLTLFFRAILAKQHGAAPEQSLLIHSLFQDLRNHLADPAYLPQIMRRYLLDNPHALYLTMKPDQTLNQKESDEEKSTLAAQKSLMTQKQLQEIVEQEQKLAAYQEEVEHQSLDCLPKVTLHDVPKQAKDFPLSESSFGPLVVHHHPCFTNRILYADLVFDLPEIDFKDLALLSLFTRFWVDVGSGGRDYAQTLDLQQASLGDLSAAISLYVQNDDPASCRPAISLRAKALERNIEPLLHLLSDFSKSPDFGDKTRLKELLLEHATELQNRLPRDLMSYAVHLASSGLSESSSIVQALQGLPYFSFVCEHAKSSPSKLGQQFQRLHEKVIGKTGPALVISCNRDEHQRLIPHLAQFAESLPQRNLPAWKPNTFSTSVASQGKIIPAHVAFSVLAFNTVAYRDTDSAALLVATDLMENVILHKEIREKGGAYGSGASYSPATGQFHFYAYRDTHLFRTYQAFQEAIDRVAAQKFTDRELTEAKLGILQDLDAPLPPRQRAICAFGWQRTGRTFAKRDAYRRSVLEVSDSDVAHAVAKHLSIQRDQGIFVSFASQDLFEKEAKMLPFAFEISPIQFCC